MKSFLLKVLFKSIPFLLKPKRDVNIEDVGLITLIGHRYTTMFIYTVMSFFYHSGIVLPIFVVDDGTLTLGDKKLLNTLFMVTILSKEECESKLKKKLKKYRALHNYRFANYVTPVKLKFDGLLLSPFERNIFLDCDVLFFKPPIEIQQWVHKKSQEALYIGYDSSRLMKTNTTNIEFAFRALLKEVCYPKIDRSFNTGLLCLPSKKMLDLNKLNAVFKHFEKLDYNRGLTLSEETAIAIVFSVYKYAKILNKEAYLVAGYMFDYEERFNAATRCIHYCWQSKPRFVPDSVKLALNTHLFSNNS